MRRSSLLVAFLLLGLSACSSKSSSTLTLDPQLSTVTVDRSTGVLDDGQDHATVTITLVDASGQGIPNTAVILSATGTGNVISQPAPTNSSGKTTGTLASTQVGVVTLTATVGTVVVAQMPTVQFITGSAGQLGFTVQPSEVTAGSPINPAVQVSIEDAAGNPITTAADPVVLSLGAGTSGATLSGTLTVTAVAGVAIFTNLTITTAGTGFTLVATSGSLKSVTSMGFNVDAGSPAQMSFLVQPSTVLAGTAIAPPIQVGLQDLHGNTITSATDSVTISIGNNPSAGILSGTTTQSAVAGVATFGDLSIDAAGSGYTFVVTSANFGSAASQAFNVSAGAASSSLTTLTASPTTVVADGVSTTMLTVVVVDAGGNPLSGVNVGFSASGTGNMFTPLGAKSDLNGVVISALSSTGVGTETVTASIGGFTETAMVTFTAGPPADSNTKVTITPASVVANGTAVATVTVTAGDALGHPIVGQSVSLQVSGSGNTLATGSGLIGMDGAFVTTLTSTTAEVKTVTATVGALSPVGTVKFIAGPVVASMSTLVATPPSATADGTTQVTLTLTAADMDGNPVGSQAVTLASTGLGDQFASMSGTTDPVTGIFSTTLTSTTAGTDTITAMLGSIPVIGTVTFNPGPVSTAPGKSSLTVSSVSVPAGGGVITVTVVAEDARGNVIPNLLIKLTGSKNGNTFTPASMTTDANGQVVSRLSCTIAQMENVVANFGTSSLSTPVAFSSMGGISSTNTTIGASPLTVPADGMTSTTITVNVRDSMNSPVSGQSVVMTPVEAGVVFSPYSGVSNGMGTFTSTLTSTVAKTVPVVATLGAYTFTISINFVAGPASATTSTLTLTPSSVTADGFSSSTILVTVLDANNNPIDGAGVVVTTNGTSTTIPGPSGATGTDGAFITSATSSLTQTETISAAVTGSAGSFTLTQPLTFAAGPPASSRSSIVATPSSVVADGMTPINLVVTANDQQGNPVANALVTFKPSGTMTTFTPMMGMTNAQGVLTATATSPLVQTEYLEATLGSSAGVSAQVMFTTGAVSSGNSTFTESPMSVTTDGMAQTVLTVSLKDASMNPIANEPVSFTASGSANTWNPSPMVTTNASGVCSVRLSSTKAQTEMVIASFGSSTLQQTVTFTPGAVSPTTSMITASSATAVAGGLITITVTALDGQGNIVANQPVTLTAAGSSNTFGSTTSATNASGVFTGTISSTVAQSEPVTAKLGAATVTTMVTFTPGPPASAKTSLQASATSTTVALPLLLTATVEDQYGNFIPNETVTFKGSGSANAFSGSSGATSSVGATTINLTSTTAQAETITVTAGAATATTVVSFIAGHAVAANSTFVPNPTSLTADMSLCTVTLTLADMYGNLCPSIGVDFTVSGALDAQNHPTLILPATGTSAQTSALGIATTQVYTTKAQTGSVIATMMDGSFALTATVQFNAGPVVIADSTFTITSEIPSDNSTAATAIVTLNDQYLNPVPNISVTLAAIPGTITVAPSATVTTSTAAATLGEALFSVTSSVGGVYAVTATEAGAAIGTQTLVVNGSPIATAVSPVRVDTGLSGCSTKSSNTGQKVAVDSGNFVYVALNCSGTVYVATSTTGGASYHTPVSTTITGASEVAIAAGATAGTVAVAAYTTGGTIVLATSSNGGNTWTEGPLTTGMPAVNITGSAAGNGAIAVSLALTASSYDVGYNTSAGPKLASGTPGAWTVSSSKLTEAQTSYFSVLEDSSGNTYVADEDSSLEISVLASNGTAFKGPYAVSGTQGTSAWALGGSFIYNAGDTGNVYRIPTSSVTGGTPTATTITGIGTGVGSGVGIAADSSGNLYTAIQTSSGAIEAQYCASNATALSTATANVTSSGGSYPCVVGSPTVAGATLVVYTTSGGVFSAVVVL